MELNPKKLRASQRLKNNCMSNIAIIEFQLPSGNWLKVCDCANNPFIIKQIMDATFRSNPSYQKLRAIDQSTKQIIDLGFR